MKVPSVDGRWKNGRMEEWKLGLGMNELGFKT
jgi:hypothetical protein